MKKRKVYKLASSMTTGILFILLIIMAMAVISAKASGGEPKLFGHQLKVVLSGSMEPTIKTGSIIAVKPIGDASNLKEDDIITFVQQDESIVTHRIINVVKNGEHTLYETKGDNNQDPDSELVSPQNVLAVYSGFTIPYLGYFVDFAKTSTGAAILLIVPGLILIGYSILLFYQVIREIEKLKGKEMEQTTNL